MRESWKINRTIAISVILLSSPLLADEFDSLLDYVDEVRATHQAFDQQFDTSNVQLATSSCSTPGTLMQLSYGTSFSGGPDRDEPLITDRPDFTEAATTVGLGVAQLEMGYTYSFDQTSTNSVENHSYGEPLLRIGMFAEWFELRVGWNYANEITTTAGVQNIVSGSEDMYLGAKIALTPQECLLPEMALIPQMTVPTASTSNFGSGTVLPGINWIYGWELNDRISTAGSSQINRALDEMTGNPYLEFAQSWTVAFALTECIGGYTEWFAFVPDGADTNQTEHYFNGGFTFLLNNDIQFDIRAGVGLSDASDDYILGTGLSIRC